MLEEVVSELKKGVTVDGLRLRAEDLVQSRSGNEVDCAVYVSFSGEKESLLIIRFFYGLKGHYLPWAEFFAIKPSVHVGGRALEYFGSSVEEKMLKLTANHLRAGGAVFVEYDADDETSKQLRKRVPTPLTRLGFLLYGMGFTWFKDFYFAEGFKEGGAKLRAEKPIDRKAKVRHVKEIKKDAQEFLEMIKKEKTKDPLVLKAAEMAKSFLAAS